jgi:hypothetical protein
MALEQEAKLFEKRIFKKLKKTNRSGASKSLVKDREEDMCNLWIWMYARIACMQMRHIHHARMLTDGMR